MAKHDIVLIDDNDLDASLLENALMRVSPDFRISRARDGHQGLQEIQSTSPSMVLLDLSMPGLTGFEVLDRIRNDHQISKTPVIVCSNSDSQRDIETSYAKQANAYVVKPDSTGGYAELADGLNRFWYGVAELP